MDRLSTLFPHRLMVLGTLRDIHRPPDRPYTRQEVSLHCSLAQVSDAEYIRDSSIVRYRGSHGDIICTRVSSALSGDVFPSFLSILFWNS
jgi:hypothetical protein